MKYENKFNLTITPIVVIISLFLSFLIIGNPFIAFKNKQLEKSIFEVKDSTEMYINEVIPFEWEMLYTFPCETNKQTMENVMGFKSKDIPSNTEDNSLNLIFVKNNQVISQIYTNPKDIGFNIVFEDIIYFKDNCVFNVSLEEKTIILKHRNMNI